MSSSHAAPSSSGTKKGFQVTTPMVLLVLVPISLFILYKTYDYSQAETKQEQTVVDDDRKAVTEAEPAKAKLALPHDNVDLPMAWHMDQSQWPRLTVPAHSDSAHVPIPFGMHIVWGGSGFTAHYIYADGTDCSSNESTGGCKDGGVMEAYARSDTDGIILVSYAYARANEK